MKDKFNKFELVAIWTIVAYFVVTFAMSYIYYNVTTFNTVWMVVPLAVTIAIASVCHFFNPETE